MKRLLCIVLSFLLICPIVALGDGVMVPIHLESMSTDELLALEAAIQIELQKREGSFSLIMDGQSMTDTINEGDRLTFHTVNVADLKRFEIVAVNFPKRGDTVFIKRLIGLPGDTIELRDGYLYINGEKYDEPYINDEYRAGRLNTFGPYTVPDNQYFVLGDHRNNSNDSRSTGPLSADMILGVLDSQE